VVAFDKGVDDFLSKSANLYELAARVYGTGRTARLQNEIRQKNRDLTNHYQNHNQLCLTDKDTGLANRKQLEISFSTMAEHCKARGGGVGLCLIRVNTEDNQSLEDSSTIQNIRKGTLRTISNSLKLVLRPMDQIVRYDECTFAISLLHDNQQKFNSEMFKRSTNSILKHTNQFTDEGKKLRLSISIWYSDEFDPLPDLSEVLVKAEANFQSVEV